MRNLPVRQFVFCKSVRTVILFVPLLLITLHTSAFVQTNRKEEGKQAAYDASYLKEQKKQIDRLINRRQFGKAYKRARTVRQNYDDVDDNDLHQQAVDLYNDVLKRNREAFHEVIKKVDRYMKHDAPYKAYTSIKQALSNFKGTNTWEQRLRKRKQSIKPAVVEAYRKGRLDEVPAFIPEDSQQSDSSKGEQKNRSSSGNDQNADSPLDFHESNDSGKKQKPEETPKGYQVPYEGPTDRQVKLIDQTGGTLIQVLRDIEKGEIKKAAEQLIPLKKKLGTPRLPTVEAMAARIYMLAERPKVAEKLIRPYARTRNEEGYNERLKRCYLVDGIIKRAQKKPNEAIEVLDWLTANASPGRVRVRAAELLGQTLMESTRYRKAIQSFKFALDALDHLHKISNEYEDDSYDSDEQEKNYRSLTAIRASRDGDAINRYRASEGMRAITQEVYRADRNRIRSRLENARRKLKIDLYGKDYVVFKEADKLRQSGKYEKAIEKYRKVIEEFGTSDQKPGWAKRQKQQKQTAKKEKREEKKKGQNNEQEKKQEKTPSAYVPPARLYEAVCLKRMGKLSQATQKLSKFYQEKPLWKYRGEALLQLALIHSVKRLDPFPHGQKYFQKLDKWIKNVREKTDLELMNLVKKEEAIDKITPPQQEYRKHSDPEVLGGGKKKVEVKPGQLINRKTAEWYLTDLEETAAAFRGFLHFVQGNDDKALQHYERMVELDPENRAGSFALNPNNYTRLRYGPKNGYLVALPEELKLYRGRKRYAVLLIDFFYVQKKFERAQTIAGRVLDGAAGRLSLEQKDYLHYIIGHATMWTDGYKAAYPHYKKVYESRQGTITEPRAMFSAGKMALKSREDKLMKKGKRLWREIIRSGKKTNTVLKTMVSWGTYLGNQQKYRQAIRALKKVPEVEKEELKKWSSAADFQMKFYRKKLKNKETKP